MLKWVILEGGIKVGGVVILLKYIFCWIWYLLDKKKKIFKDDNGIMVFVYFWLDGILRERNVVFLKVNINFWRDIFFDSEF